MCQNLEKYIHCNNNFQHLFSRLLRVIMQEIVENTDPFRLVYVKFIPTRHILIIATLTINLINIAFREVNN